MQLPFFQILNQKSNLVFTLFFLLDVVIKVIGQGLFVYLKEKFNQFDFFIVLVSIVEIMIATNSETGIFSAFRGFRLFKIFKLFRSGDLSILIDSIGFTMASISDYAILLVIFIYIFALMGMSFFASMLKFNSETNLYDPDGEVPRTNFDYLG